MTEDKPKLMGMRSFRSNGQKISVMKLSIPGKDEIETRRFYMDKDGNWQPFADENEFLAFWEKHKFNMEDY